MPILFFSPMTDDNHVRSLVSSLRRPCLSLLSDDDHAHPLFYHNDHAHYSLLSDDDHARPPLDPLWPTTTMPILLFSPMRTMPVLFILLSLKTDDNYDDIFWYLIIISILRQCPFAPFRSPRQPSQRSLFSSPKSIFLSWINNAFSYPTINTCLLLATRFSPMTDDIPPRRQWDDLNIKSNPFLTSKSWQYPS